MRTWSLLASPLFLASCAWGPVLTPYAVRNAERMPAPEVATVWGVRQGATLYFTQVDGESMPSRGGGGYPVSLTLAPGQHTLRVYVVMPDHRSTEQSIAATVEAGHTYVVEYLAIPGTPAILLKLVDHGLNKDCRYIDGGGTRTTLVLHCSAPLKGTRP